VNGLWSSEWRTVRDLVASGQSVPVLEANRDPGTAAQARAVVLAVPPLMYESAEERGGGAGNRMGYARVWVYARGGTGTEEALLVLEAVHALFPRNQVGSLLFWPARTEIEDLGPVDGQGGPWWTLEMRVLFTSFAA
jgi:hypothetical protein